ncbi:MAG: glucose-1-phosphate adenylyltransferase [Elusimicrobia bacterium]|nr:glucose-1-phosphate adenylyltransferase [Elusimicrobiota bacterium]
MSAPNREDLLEPEKSTVAVIMGGGAGKRLYPLTKMRSKPAVPFGGKYRLVDIPISNCLNSGIRHIYVLTQFNSASLHKHIKLTYRFDNFSKGYVEILAAQQTPSSEQWYQGTADAVRQNLRYITEEGFPYVLILSGDQLYRIDFEAMLRQHVETGADITIAAMPVGPEETGRLGILQVDAEKRIVRFFEKPQSAAELDGLEVPEAALATLGLGAKAPAYLASMGIYIFNRERLMESLHNDFPDFGHDILPRVIKDCRVLAYPYKGYWEDIGTIKSFFDANLALTDVLPRFNFFDTRSPIYTHARALPASKLNGGRFQRTLISDGCIVDDSRLERCVVGVRSIIAPGCDIRDTVMLGADAYESAGSIARHAAEGLPPIGIGPGCRIRRAIIDKNARIGAGAVITPDNKPAAFDSENYCIRDGIVVIPKDAVIPAGSVL